jgi:hypothetical protein
MQQRVKQHKFAIRIYSGFKILICVLNLLLKLFEQPVLFKCNTKAVLPDSIQASLYFWIGKALKRGRKIGSEKKRSRQRREKKE